MTGTHPTAADQELELLLTGLRSSELDFTGSPITARADFEEMLGRIPVAPDLQFEELEFGGIPTLRCISPGVDPHGPALLYLHGGAYVVGSARGYRGLAGELGRSAGVVTYALDYRLAPENRFPAAVEDVVSAYRAMLERGMVPSRIAIGGDSAGGGLVVASLLALRDQGLPQPAAALAISPWVDLRCGGRTLITKADEDPSLSAAGLLAMAGHYLGNAVPTHSWASPGLADLSDLPPLLIQVGSAEILLDDAVLLARSAGQAGVAVRLDVWPGMPHVWHAFGFMLTAGRHAIDEAGAFLHSKLVASSASSRLATAG